MFSLGIRYQSGPPGRAYKRLRARLVYSNDPTKDGGGNPDTPNEPKPDEVTGQTPESRTDTFTTQLKITKVDGQNTTKTLAGAKFKITGTKKETAPVTADQGYTADQYDSTTQKYKKVTTIGKTTVGNSTFEA